MGVRSVVNTDFVVAESTDQVLLTMVDLECKQLAKSFTFRPDNPEWALSLVRVGNIDDP